MASAKHNPNASRRVGENRATESLGESPRGKVLEMKAYEQIPNFVSPFDYFGAEDEAAEQIPVIGPDNSFVPILGETLVGRATGRPEQDPNPARAAYRILRAMRRRVQSPNNNRPMATVDAGDILGYIGWYLSARETTWEDAGESTRREAVQFARRRCSAFVRRSPSVLQIRAFRSHEPSLMIVRAIRRLGGSIENRDILTKAEQRLVRALSGGCDRMTILSAVSGIRSAKDTIRGKNLGRGRSHRTNHESTGVRATRWYNTVQITNGQNTEQRPDFRLTRLDSARVAQMVSANETRESTRTLFRIRRSVIERRRSGFVGNFQPKPEPVFVRDDCQPRTVSEQPMTEHPMSAFGIWSEGPVNLRGDDVRFLIGHCSD